MTAAATCEAVPPACQSNVERHSEATNSLRARGGPSGPAQAFFHALASPCRIVSALMADEEEKKPKSEALKVRIAKAGRSDDLRPVRCSRPRPAALSRPVPLLQLKIRSQDGSVVDFQARRHRKAELTARELARCLRAACSAPASLQRRSWSS